MCFRAECTALQLHGKDSSHSLSLKHGDCVMLVFVPGLEFIATFLGCLRAGLIAVPVSTACAEPPPVRCPVPS